MAEGHRIFIIDHDPDLLSMMSTVVQQELSDLGCDIRTDLLDPHATNLQEHFERIKQFAPDLVILDFLPGRSASWQLLDLLRMHEETSSIPILALSTFETVTHYTLLSHNVRRWLTKPFDLAALGQAIHDILAEPPLTIPSLQAQADVEELREAAHILNMHARAIMAEWWCQVTGLRGPTAPPPPLIIDHVPMLLWATIVALYTGNPEDVFNRQEAFRDAMRKHALARKREGVELGTCVHEITVLRDILWEFLGNNYPKGQWSPDTVFRAGTIIHHALKTLIAVAIDTYLRDSVDSTA